MIVRHQRLGDDYSWIGPLITAAGQIAVTVVKAATTPQGQQQCPPGYVYHPELGGCITAQNYALWQQGGSQQAAPQAELIAGVPNVALLIGGGLLLVLLSK